MGGDFNAFSYKYFRSGSQQIAASLQDSSLVMLRRFDEDINAQHRGVYDNSPEYQFRNDIYMTYHDEHIQEEYRLMRNAIRDDVTDAAGESAKIPRLQRALQEFDENFDLIFWDRARNKSLSIDNRYQRDNRVPQSKSTTSRTSAPSATWPAKRRCADCQAWHKGLHLSCFSSDSEIRICTELSRWHCSHGRHWQG